MLNITFHALTGTLIALTLNIFTLKYTQTCLNTEHLNYTTQTSTDHIHSLAALQCSKYHYNKTNTPSRHTLMLLLLLCGDTGAMVNPGRRHPKYACEICGQRAIQCDNCCEWSEHADWYHVSCIGSFT